ncbi:MAG: ribosome silencing factor [Alphaproteobacteria bacterium]|nr:ribosome silencing factor [Alphaproteobacteria bacterium]
MANLKKKTATKAKAPRPPLGGRGIGVRGAVGSHPRSTGNTASNRSVKKPAAKKSVAAKKPVAKKAPAKKTAPKLQGIPEQLLAAALKVLDERQAEEIVTVPLAGRSSIADYLIIASGRAGRQIVAIADHLREAFFKLGVRHIRVEGQGDANWVLIDAGDVIIHLFRPEVRRYYDLDAMWKGKGRG